MADLNVNTAITTPTGFLGHSASIPGTLTPNRAQTLLWSATRRVDVAADNNLTLSAVENVQGTDVQPQIQDAIDDVNAAGGGIVYLQPGVWWIGAPIRMKSRVHLMGSGYGPTLIKLRNAVNNHCIINDVGTAELYSIGQLRIDGARNAQGVPAGTENIWVNGLHLVWNTSGFTFTDPQCYFYDLWIMEVCADCYYFSGRGGHLGVNLRGGNCRRWGANLDAWDSIFYGFYLGGIGADGIRMNQGPNLVIGAKSFFTGLRTTALTNAALRLVDGSSLITPSAEDWRYGAGFRMTAAGHMLSCCESQDTCGHGIVIDGTTSHTVTSHRFGNIGSLGRHFAASYANEATFSDIACVYLNGLATGNYVNGVINDQFTENGGEQPQCDWLVNSNAETVRNNTIDIAAQPVYLRMSGRRFTKTASAKNFLANDFRIGNEHWEAEIANFTAVKADHQRTFWLEPPLTTVTAVAATVGNGWAVRIINKADTTVTAGGQSITNGQDGVLSSNGSAFTWTNGASLTTGRVRELLESTTITVEDTGRMLLCKAVLTITGTAANLGDGFRCVVLAQGGNVTWGSATIDSGNRAAVEVMNGSVYITETTPVTA